MTPGYASWNRAMHYARTLARLPQVAGTRYRVVGYRNYHGKWRYALRVEKVR